MPRFPAVSPVVEGLGGSIYSSLGAKLRDYRGEVYPLHIGDTWMEPAPECQMQSLLTSDHPGMHRYTPPLGMPELREAAAKAVTTRTGVTTSADEILVSAGATGGLSVALGALLSPGDEVLILAPFWPLVAGSTRAFGGKAVPVPFFGDVDSVEAALEQLDRYVTRRSMALYLNSPNNPTGRIIPRDWLEALVDWARARDLWILADEVYEHCVFVGEHSYVRSLAPERTISVHSCSKAYGMSGLRVGYVVAPVPTIRQISKIGTYSYYCAPRPAQMAAVHALGEPGLRWARKARGLYKELGQYAAATLGVDEPAGSTFLFVDVADRLDDRGLLGFLEDCAERGLFVAPGPSFGPYPTHIRVCFTSAQPERVRAGIQVLAQLLSA